MKIDGTLVGVALAGVGRRARQLEATGYDGAFTFEGPHDRDRVRPHPRTPTGSSTPPTSATPSAGPRGWKHSGAPPVEPAVARLLIGTDDGVVELGGSRALAGHRVNALFRDGWAVIDARTVVREVRPGEWEELASLPAANRTEHRPLVSLGDEVIVGTGDGLLRLRNRDAEPVPSFADVEGRDAWHAVGSSEPYVRSLTATTDGVLFANVHVGGIPRSTDGGATWEPTIDVDADVHQARAHPDRPGLVLAAAAVGVGVSHDGGDTWSVHTDCLHASYCRAVAPTGDTVLVTASTGPFTDRSAVYRRAIDGRGPFERVSEWFPHNIDTECLVADGDDAAFGGPDGRVFVSTDRGASWEVGAEDLAPVTAVAYARR